MKTFLETQDQKTKIEYLNKFALDLDLYLPRLLVCNKNCAYALANLTKKKRAKEILLSTKETYENLVLELIDNADAKIRKYAYVICGNLPTENLYNRLKEQIYKEETYLTLPSLMLSLVGKDCKDLLERACKEQEQIAPKIYAEIVTNYNLVNPRKFDTALGFNFTSASGIIFTQKCYEDFIIKDLALYNKQKLKCGIKINDITPKDYQILAKRRDIYSFSLILSQNANLKECLNLGLKYLDDIVDNGDFAYRISCQDSKINSAVLKEIKTINLSNLTNSPNNYSISVEVIIQNGYLLVASLESCKEKFTYRQEFLPASINPTTANIICKIAHYYNPNAKIIADGFCGTGTMLIERKLVNKSVSLIGSDISKIAITKAKNNLNNIGFKAKLSCCDIADFKESNLDEFISNLPYGLRVGTHSDNFKIYKNLVFKLEKHLVKGGFAFLYTADKKLLRDLIKFSTLKLVSELNFISGGLYCSLFIVQK